MNLLKLLKPIGKLFSYLNYKIDRLRLQNLITRGLKVGKNVYIHQDVKFDYNYPYLIEIEDDCCIARDVKILAHDATTWLYLGVTRTAKVRILKGSFIGEGAIILPGVTIGPRALITAGSVVNRDIGEDGVAAGNPARPYGKYSELLDKYRERISSAEIFDKAEIENYALNQEDIIKAIDNDNIAFIYGMPRNDPYYVNADLDQIKKQIEKSFKKLIKRNE